MHIISSISNLQTNIEKQIDGETDETELELIRQIGISENLTDEDIDKVIATADHNEGIPSIDKFSDNQKLELLINLVLVMKIDGIVHKNEMEFCLNMIDKLGYDRDRFYELVSSTTNDIKSERDINDIKDKTKALFA